MDPVTITLYGRVPSKKNQYRAVIKKTGKAALVKDRKLNAKLDYLVQQIDKSLWARFWEHPDIEWKFFRPKEDFFYDRDGVITCILDLLTLSTKTLKGDSCKECNGMWKTWPTEVSDEFRTEITLYFNRELQT